MALFHCVDDAFVILRRKGVYRQSKVYARGDHLYAGYGAGFVRLMRSGTSHPDVSWEDLTENPRIKVSRSGEIMYSQPALKVVHQEAAE